MTARPVDRAASARDAGYRVRPMVRADAAYVAEVHVRVWREAYESIMPADYLAGLEVEELTQQWRSRLSGGDDRVVHVVGEHPDGRVVAIGSAGPSRDREPPTDWELWAINVLSSEHGTGLADLLMTALVGPRPCSLWVVEDNGRAQRFYERHGFRADGSRTQHPPTGVTEVRLVRTSPA